jgi:hypothetical protein
MSAGTCWEDAGDVPDVYSVVRSLVNTGVVDNDIVTVLARAKEEIAEDAILLTEQTGVDRKRDPSDDGIQVKEEE